MTTADPDAMNPDAQFTSSGLAAQTVMDPEPEDDLTGGRGPAGGHLGLGGWLRWTWRQLTSMRTALILLFLLALASVPGSVLPQEGIDPAAVSQYYAAHPGLAPFLNKLSLFSVFAAPWFAAIYLLLFASLAGCVLPRTFRLVGSARQKPPRAPSNLARLPFSASYQSQLPPAEALQAAETMLRDRRFRVQTGDGWVSAEKGYLREVGNLLFHIALLALLFSVALGGIFGYKANRLLVVGQGFANTPTALDVFRPGRLVSPSSLQPFEISLLGFKAQYVTSGPQMDQPITYQAPMSYRASPGAPLRHYVLTVNHPLVVDNVSVYLIGHGYAPDFTVTDGAGHVVWKGPVPFIPVDQISLESEGVVKVPDAQPAQLGFAGVFLPTEVAVDGQLQSAFPAALNPRVSLVAYAGNLGMNGPDAQSVYDLDTNQMHQLKVTPRPLAPGQSIKLPGGDGTLTFTGYTQWASLAITYDPGQLPALISAVVALLGLILSFLVRRRRFFVRARAADGGGTEVLLGGLARSDAAGGFETEFTDMTAQFRTLHAASQTAEGGTSVPVPSETAITADADPALAGQEGSES